MSRLTYENGRTYNHSEGTVAFPDNCLICENVDKTKQRGILYQCKKFHADHYVRTEPFCMSFKEVAKSEAA